MKSAARILLLFTAALALWAAWSLSRQPSSTHLTSIVGDRDNRRAFAELAKVPRFDGKIEYVYQRYGATGHFWCNQWQSATLVRRKKRLILNAHSLYHLNEKEQCVPNGDWSDCFFQVSKTDGTLGKPYYIEPRSVRVSKNYRCRPGEEFNLDWAVAELKGVGPDFDNPDLWPPFEIFDVRGVDRAERLYAKLRESDVTVLSAEADNLPEDLQSTPTACFGKLGYIWKMKTQDPIMSAFGIGVSCSSGHGNSGGAVLVDVPGSTPLVIGLVSFTMNKPRDFHPFGPDNFTGGPLLEGEFYDAVMSDAD